MHGIAIDNCVVVTHFERDPHWDLEDEDHDLISRYSKLLELSAFAKNDYNKTLGCYSNSSHFQFVRQRFTLPVNYIFFSTRRRDGETSDGGYLHGEIKFPMPLQAKNSNKTCIDTEFVSAMVNAVLTNSPVARSLQAALTLFDLANSDSDLMQLRAEVILMANAFELLLKAYGAREIANAVATLMSPFIGASVGDAQMARPGIFLKNNNEQSWPVHKKWAEEFYHLRNQYIHVGTLSSRTWGWQPIEHMVMAAPVFPLLIKLLLEKEGRYKLSDDDEGKLKATDKLLVAMNWAQRTDENSNSRVWQSILQETINDIVLTKAIKSIDAPGNA